MSIDFAGDIFVSVQEPVATLPLDRAHVAAGVLLWEAWRGRTGAAKQEVLDFLESIRSGERESCFFQMQLRDGFIEMTHGVRRITLRGSLVREKFMLARLVAERRAARAAGVD